MFSKFQMNSLAPSRDASPVALRPSPRADVFAALSAKCRSYTGRKPPEFRPRNADLGLIRSDRAHFEYPAIAPPPSGHEFSSRSEVGAASSKAIPSCVWAAACPCPGSSSPIPTPEEGSLFRQVSSAHWGVGLVRAFGVPRRCFGHLYHRTARSEQSFSRCPIGFSLTRNLYPVKVATFLQQSF